MMDKIKTYLYVFISITLVTTAFALPKMNHVKCLVNDKMITSFSGQSLERCIQECVARTKCLSLNYRRRYHLCELFPSSGGPYVTNNGRTGQCVHIIRSDITGSKYSNDCSCESQQTCLLESSTCEIKECQSLEFPNGVFIGNMREIGSRVLVKCVSALYLEETGRTSIQCQTDGTWDYEPNCTSGYMGCYKDDQLRTLMPYKHWSHSQMTIEKCIEHCFDYVFAAPQYYNQCFCGNNLAENLTRPEADCNTPCVGNQSQICGGTWRGSVYRLS